MLCQHYQDIISLLYFPVLILIKYINVMNLSKFLGQQAFIEEVTKDLWGRTDDESCVRELENELNDTSLATNCGMFSQYFKHIQTPMFIIASQYHEPDFNRITCNVSKEDEDYFTYNTLWKQGVMTMIQVSYWLFGYSCT